MMPPTHSLASPPQNPKLWFHLAVGIFLACLLLVGIFAWLYASWRYASPGTRAAICGLPPSTQGATRLFCWLDDKVLGEQYEALPVEEITQQLVEAVLERQP